MKKILTALTVVVSAFAFAHAVVRTEMGLSESKAGASETYRLRVPTEKAVATVAVRLVVPMGLTVTGFESLPAWQRSVVKDDKGLVREVTWKGGSIGEMEYALFPFRAKNPSTPGVLWFKVYQTYADGTVVAWDKEDPKADLPASSVEIK